MRRIVSSALIAVYSLFILANLYVMVLGGFSLTRGIFLALCVFAIIAVSGKGGGDSRFWAYILCGILGIVGASLVGYSIWAYASDPPVDSTVMWTGPILVFLAATTYWVIKSGKQSPTDQDTELDSR